MFFEDLAGLFRADLFFAVLEDPLADFLHLAHVEAPAPEAGRQAPSGRPPRPPNRRGRRAGRRSRP